jgi:hypothetical protein
MLFLSGIGGDEFSGMVTCGGGWCCPVPCVDPRIVMGVEYWLCAGCMGGVTSLIEDCFCSPGTGCSLGGRAGIGDGGLGPDVLVMLPPLWDILLPTGCSTVVLPPGPVVVVVVVVVCWSASVHAV